MADQAVPESGPKPAPVVIKKYANRRLYNTATSAYVTLEHLSKMVKEKTDFVVYDAKTGDDITRSVLTQIIFEEESKGGQNAAADPLPAPAHLVLRRQPAGRGAAVSRDVDERSSRATRTRCAATCRMPSASTRSSSSKRWASRTWRCSRTPCGMFNPFAAGQAGADASCGPGPTVPTERPQDRPIGCSRAGGGATRQSRTSSASSTSCRTQLSDLSKKS